jgi:hypothetical protein
MTQRPPLTLSAEKDATNFDLERSRYALIAEVENEKSAEGIKPPFRDGRL